MIRLSVAFVTALMIAIRIIWCDAALAGTTGVVSGYVYDGAGHPLSGASVGISIVKDWSELSLERSPKSFDWLMRTTDADGFFVYLSLKPGDYTIWATAKGKFFDCAPRIIVDADQTTFVRLSMMDFFVLGTCAPPRYFYPSSERISPSDSIYLR